MLYLPLSPRSADLYPFSFLILECNAQVVVTHPYVVIKEVEMREKGGIEWENFDRQLGLLGYSAPKSLGVERRAICE
jgi:hypothetical protein